MAKRYYAIKQGRKTGIFTGQWKEVQKKYIQGFPNPEYKGFNDRKEAEKYLDEPSTLRPKRDKKQIRITQLDNEKKIEKRR